MEQFILCETIEREISTPAFFDTIKEAQEEMAKRFKAAANLTDDDMGNLDEYEACLDETKAYCTNKNHDNCDWAIFQFNKEGN